MTTIFLDECGHTGEDLLSRDQPFFVLASLTLTEQDCSDIKRQYFHKVQAHSLKHKSLAKSKAHQRSIINFLKDISTKQNFFKVALAHKKYALVCKMVDMIVEPYLHENGFDLYDRGANIAMANLFYQTMPVFGGEEFFSELLLRFQEMMRLRTNESYNNFFHLVFQEHENWHLNEELNMLRPAHFFLRHKIFLDLPNNALDIAFSHAMLMMATWRKEIAGSIYLVHDVSSNMSNQQDIWDALMDPNLNPLIAGYDRRKMAFPIAINKTSFDKDEDWAGLQLADVIAGAFARCAKWLYFTEDPDDTYGHDLANTIADISVIPLLPGTEMTPDELGTTEDNAEDLINHITSVMGRAKNKSN